MAEIKSHPSEDVQPEEATVTTAASSRLRQVGLCVVAVLLCVAAAVWYWGSSEPREEFDLPPIAASRFLNTTSKATYVGSQKCAECHKDAYRTYLQTAHSQASAEIDLEAEPPDAEFAHKASGRHYQVYREGGQMWHRETLPLADGSELLVADHPMRYVVGSGHHSRTYLVDIDGFLYESPVTWYAKGNLWAMSPGYDRPDTVGFERPANLKCMMCHAGGVESVGGSPHRLKLQEHAIGCERCHGPGSLHVAKHSGVGQPIATPPATDDSGADLTIVHPGRLSRERREAVCAHCHLATNAISSVAGRHVTDFRPGLNLADFRSYYLSEDDSMTVVGHVEQMRLSRCYQKSTMTCTTCHHPHEKPAKEDRLTYFRNKCISCHETDTCGLPEPERLKRNAQDNCVACHMPASDTEIPHIASTHHRIQIPKWASGEPATDEGRTTTRLKLVYDRPGVPPIHQDRGRGLAWLELAQTTQDPKAAHTYGGRAKELLLDVKNRGLRSPEVDLGLALLYGVKEPERAIEFAGSALQFSNIPDDTRTEALWSLAMAYANTDQPERAVATIEQLSKLTSNSNVWHLDATCRLRLGDIVGALRSAEKAERFSPTRPDIQLLLSEIYLRLSRRQDAEMHRRRAQILQESLPR